MDNKNPKTLTLDGELGQVIVDVDSSMTLLQLQDRIFEHLRSKHQHITQAPLMLLNGDYPRAGRQHSTVFSLINNGNCTISYTTMFYNVVLDIESVSEIGAPNEGLRLSMDPPTRRRVHQVLDRLIQAEAIKHAGKTPEYFKLDIEGISEISEAMLALMDGTAIISSLGEFNRGKTHIMSKLSGCALPSGQNVHTAGLSLKLMPGSRFLYLDTAGFNSPIDQTFMSLVESEMRSKKDKKLVELETVEHNLKQQLQAIDNDVNANDRQRDRVSMQLRETVEAKDAYLRRSGWVSKRVTESFLRDLVIELADGVLFVNNEVMWQDQLLLEEVVERWKYKMEHDGRGKCGRVIVVNNFKGAKNDEELQASRKRYVEDMHAGISRKPDRLYDQAGSVASEWTFFETVQRDMYHFFTANSDTPVGQIINPKVINYISDLLLSVDPPRKVTFLQHLLSCIQNVLSRHIVDQHVNIALIVRPRRNGEEFHSLFVKCELPQQAIGSNRFLKFMKDEMSFQGARAMLLSSRFVPKHRVFNISRKNGEMADEDVITFRQVVVDVPGLIIPERVIQQGYTNYQRPINISIPGEVESNWLYWKLVEENGRVSVVVKGERQRVALEWETKNFRPYGFSAPDVIIGRRSGRFKIKVPVEGVVSDRSQCAWALHDGRLTIVLPLKRQEKSFAYVTPVPPPKTHA